MYAYISLVYVCSCKSVEAVFLVVSQTKSSTQQNYKYMGLSLHRNAHCPGPSP